MQSRLFSHLVIGVVLNRKTYEKLVSEGYRKLPVFVIITQVVHLFIVCLMDVALAFPGLTPGTPTGSTRGMVQFWQFFGRAGWGY